ncbi:MAG: sensor histidine kinase, partial [Kiritimatiellae bacterium]|nr:sensor histidine kinase [Kiritimatiellia bacterium]
SAPAPFAVPELALPGQYTRAEEVLRLGRRRVSGEVIAAWNGNRLLIRADVANDAKSVNNGAPARIRHHVGVDLRGVGELPPAGTRVTVDGYPVADVFLNLRKARFRAETASARTEASAETPKRTTPRQIVRYRRGRATFTLRDHGKLVTMGGVVRSLPAPNDENRRMILQCEGDLVPVDASASPDALADVEVGCVVDVTGVCVLESTPAAGLDVFPRITGFTLVPRDARDVAVVERPPWWTPARLSALVAVLAFALAAILVWNVLLRRLADRRGRELARESIARAASQLKLGERTRLAAELHDSIAQNLTGASLELRTAKRALASNPAVAANHLDFALKAIDSSRGDVRNCIWDLRNRALDADRLDEAVRTTLQPHLGGARLAVRFFVPRNRLSDSAAHALLCALRELSVNALRHGGAKRLRIAGVVDGNALKCSVRDDGCGFDVASAPGMEQGHFGLQGVRERVRGLKGSFRIDSAPGRGVRAIVCVPLHEGEPT